MNERSIFLEALSKETPAQRSAFLGQACGGDAALRQRVEALLTSHEQAGSFLNKPVPERLAESATPEAAAETQGEATAAHDGPGPANAEAAGPRPLADGPGSRIGPYRLLEQIGEGGMGTVYLAEQTHPVQRQVALKIIKAGMDSAQVITRFEAERQALALMDHPNIAKVHDAGATDTGRPYFVMELVQGRPITKYCDEQRLTPRQRLELFVPVCQAIQHAHQKGVIHRDVKPSNILVALYDGKPVVKVIDFGIAKATGQRLTEKTLFTEFGAVVGTLEYMSPEQAALDNQDIDTRSDIYSLGVLLYELLTGTTPLNRARLKQAAFVEMLRVIREEEPPRPSTRLSEAKDTLAAVAAQRQTEPAKLTRLVRGELDWLVMKALEKDRDRRYETANGLAMDLRRYLADEPVQAGAPSAWYRFRKFARRNKAGLTAAALVALALLAGTAVSVWQAFRATHAEERTLVQLDETKKAGARDEKNFRKGLDAVDKMLLELGDRDLEKVPRMELVRRRLLLRALEFYDWFLQEKSDHPRARYEAGMALRRVGRIRELLGEHAKAEQAYNRALALLTALLTALSEEKALSLVRVELARVYLDRSTMHKDLGRRDPAEADNRLARDLLEAVYAKDAANQDHRSHLATALTLWSILLSDRGKLREAEKACRRAVALNETLAAEFPDDIRYQNILAGTLGNLADLIEPAGGAEEAVKLFRRVIEIVERTRRRFPESQDLRDNEYHAYLNLGTKLVQRGRGREGDEPLREAIKIGEQLAKDFPNTPGYRTSLAGAYNNRGWFLLDQKRLDEAAKHYQRAREIQQTLVEDFPKVPGYHSGLGSILNNLAMVRREQGNFGEARKLLEEAVKYQLTALGIDGKQRTYRVFLSNHCSNLARVLERVHAPAEEVDKAHEKAVAVGRKLADDYKEVADYQHAAGDALTNRAGVLEKRGKLEEARRQLHEAVKYQRAARTIDRQHPEYRKGMQSSYSRLLELLGRMDRQAEFEDVSRQAIAFLEQLIARDALTPKNQEVRARDLRMLGATLHNLALRHDQRKELVQARRLLEQAIPHQLAALAILPNAPESLQFLSNHYNALGGVLKETGQTRAAQELRRKNVAVMEKLVPYRPNDPAFRSDLAAQQNDVANALLRDGKDLEEARRLTEQAIGHQQAALKSKPGDERCRLFLCYHHKNLGDALVKLGKRAEAEKAYRDCVGVREKLATDFPASAQYRFDLAIAYLAVGDQFDADKHAAEKEKVYGQALALLREEGAKYPKSRLCRSWLGTSLHKLAVVRDRAGKFAEARDLLQEAVTHQKAACGLDPKNSDCRKKLFDHHLDLGGVFLHLNEPARAEQTVEELRRLQPESWRADYTAGGLLERLVQFHDASGSKEKAAEWRSKLDAANLAHELWKDLLTGQQARHRFLEITKEGSLTAAKGRQLHAVEMKAGRTYVLDMESKAFDTFLILEDADGARVALNDDISAANLNSRIIYTAQATATHQIVATTYTPGETGFYVLRIRELVPKQ